MIKIGDKVKIARPENLAEQPGWVSSMDHLDRAVDTVTHVADRIYGRTVYTNLSKQYALLESWVEKTGKAGEDDRFPNSCPDCGAAAYVGSVMVECTNTACRHGS